MLVLLSLAFIVTTARTVAAASAQRWKPTKNVEIVVPSGSGGAIDRTARLIQRLINEQELLDVTTSIVNKPGGGHSVGYAYLNQHAGDGHYLVVTSTNLVTNFIAGTSKMHHSEIAPVALLYNEYTVFSVSVDSPLKTAQDLTVVLKSRPETLSVGVGSAITGANSVAVGLATRLAGGDSRKIKIVTFKSSAEATTQMMGGHLTLVATSPTIVLSGIEGGRIRPLAVAAPKRLAGQLANVPTWKELGFDVAVGNWRILIGAKGLKDEQVAFWDRVIARVVTTASWLEQLERVSAVPEYLNSRETKRFLEEQDALFHDAFRELGILKK